MFDAIPQNIKPKAKQKTIHAVDLFCGAGGTSTGMLEAIEDLGLTPQLVAINHWEIAIATHYKNHPDVKHLQSSIETVRPQEVVPGGRLQLLVASPECTHHSNARGGKPRSDQKRADAWLLMKWINDLYIENILIENVKEFESWGPLNAKGLPDKRYKGQYFQQFLAALRVNYTVEHRVLNCADYGDPTTRERLFILARRGHKKIVWPSRTHASRKELAKRALQPDMFDDGTKLEPWVAAREIIDWSLEGKSIFGRSKPLSPNTMRRIFKGLEKHGLKNFLVNLKNNDRRDRSVDEPTFTQNTGNHQAVCEPFIVPQFSSPDTRDVDEPVPTLTTTSRGVGVVEVEPFTLSVERAQTNRSGPRPIEDPIATITGSPRIGIVEGEIQPFTISAGGPELEAKPVDEPLRTVLTREHQAIVEAFLIKFHGGQNAENQNSYADEPVVKAKQDYNLARWQIDAHGFWRSNGNRLFTPEELKTLSLSAIMRRFKNHSLTTVYDFEEHVKLGEGLKEANRLRTDWMVIPPQSWNENVWTDVTRIRTLNTVQAQKNRVKHLCPLQFDIVDRAITKHTMPGETVFDPFAGLMTVPYRAVLLGRRGVGVELNQDYWRDGVIYCESAEVKQKSPSLFEMFEEETDVPE